MAYDKVKKAIVDSRRYWANREQISVRRKIIRQSRKPAIRGGAPSLKELRKCIEQGYCWWCGKGGWRRLGQHTAMAHQIYANDIREIAFLLRNTAVCIREESELMSDRTLKLLREGRRKSPDWHLGIGVEHEYSEAGLKSLRDKMPIMLAKLTDDVKARAVKKAAEVNSHPHPCPVCGKIIPHSKPICCSPECRLIRQQENGRDAAITRVRRAMENSEYKLRMSQVEQHQKRKKPHICIVCGGIIPKSRPRKYCSHQCAGNPLKLPIYDIKTMYLNGISSLELAERYNCCDYTIHRHLRKNGVMIRVGAMK